MGTNFVVQFASNELYVKDLSIKHNLTQERKKLDNNSSLVKVKVLNSKAAT